MAKDYFQDITPPNDPLPRKAVKSTPTPARPAPIAIPAPKVDTNGEEVAIPITAAPERSIRNIDAPERRSRPVRPAVSEMRDPSDFGVQPPTLPPKPRRPSTFRWWPWVLAIILILALCGLALFMLRKTTVTITPRSHTVVFDQISQFTAYPASTAASDTIMYRLDTTILQASKTVSAQGTQDVETKAQGTVIVYNDYSSAPVKLIANTRFETPGGLIFRIPQAAIVPGKKGSTPGQVSVTIYADQAGQQYDTGAVSRFTIPGLQSTPAMYSNIYAQSTASTTGGFSGQQAAVDPTTLSNTVASLRSQLAQEAQAAGIAQNAASSIVLPSLIEISYQDLPQTPASNGSVQINESAQIQIPVFDLNSFTKAIAQSAGENSGGTPLSLVEGQNFGAQGMSDASSTLGADPFTFQLSGTAILVWQVDKLSLAAALAGHDQNAFNTITAGFPGIQEAHARIEPFWKTTFPSDPSGISVVIVPPGATK